MVPFPETDSDYTKFLPLHKCEISSEEKDTDFECFIELEYPELSDDFVKTVYDFEINSKKVDLESRYEHGVLVKGVKAGCRKKVVHLADFKKNNGMPEDMCFPVDSGLLEDARKKQNYTCGCYANTDEEPCADCAPKTSCNAVFYPPRSTVHEMYRVFFNCLRTLPAIFDIENVDGNC